MKKLLGIAGSVGYALGTAKVIELPDITLETGKIEPDNVEAQIKHFRDSRAKVVAHIKAIYDRLVAEGKKEESLIFDGHLALLDDDDLDANVIKIIKEELRYASYAVDSFFECCAADMEALDNQYMRERAADFRDIKNKVIYAMNDLPLQIEQAFEDNTIVIAKDLTPADTANMDEKKVVGFALQGGGATSHVIIYAKGLGLPAAICVSELLESIQDNDTIALNGGTGEVIVNPDESTVAQYKEHIEIEKKRIIRLKEDKNKEAITADGHKMGVYANIGGLEDLERAIDNGCEGVGLFRTEFLYSDLPKAPTEDELFEVFKKAAQMLKGKPIVIRTLDCGGDKPLSYIDFGHEDNPFLGYRGIRIYKENYKIFRTQLRAAYRASIYGNIRIMYPMVMSIKELRWLNRNSNSIKNELLSAGVKINEEMQTGIMIETPAAVFIADQLAKETSFFSIGSNDMTQYMLAVDRGNERIAQLYNSFYLSILRAIKITCDAAKAEGIEVGLCGEFGGDLQAVPILMALGMDELSVSGAKPLMEVKTLIRSITFDDAKQFTDKIMQSSTIEEVLEQTNLWLDTYWEQ